MNKILTLAVAGLAATTAFATSASAGSKRYLGVYKQDGDVVTKIYDDGNLDGRGCIIGKEAIVVNGNLKVVPKMKCNF